MNETVAVLGPGAVGDRSRSGSRTRASTSSASPTPESAGLIALAGLVVESPEGTLSARVEVVERLAKPVELLLVTVKAPAWTTPSSGSSRTRSRTASSFRS